jgi:hypothetical protein
VSLQNPRVSLHSQGELLEPTFRKADKFRIPCETPFSDSMAFREIQCQIRRKFRGTEVIKIPTELRTDVFSGHPSRERDRERDRRREGEIIFILRDLIRRQAVSANITLILEKKIRPKYLTLLSL